MFFVNLVFYKHLWSTQTVFFVIFFFVLFVFFLIVLENGFNISINGNNKTKRNINEIVSVQNITNTDVNKH